MTWPRRSSVVSLRCRRVSSRPRFARAFARRRVALGFALGAVVLWLADPTPATITAGVAVAAAGEAIRFWAAGHLMKSTEITMSGPYRWLAHPLYVGSSIIGVGLAIACGRIGPAVLIAMYLIVMLTVAARTEETFLRERFGAEYDRYRRSDGAGSTAGKPFSLAQALANREHRAVVGIAVAVLLLVLKATYNGAFGVKGG
jgi:protein-S-isoprenylcysteine O-methyltransferase Ste14